MRSGPLLCLGLFCLLYALQQADATAMTTMYIKCTRTRPNNVQLTLVSGTSCAPGGPCSEIGSFTLRRGRKTYTLHKQPKMSPSEKRTYQRWLLHRSRTKLLRMRWMGGRRFVGKYTAKQRTCRIGKRIRFTYSFRDWRGRRSLISIKPGKRGYRINVQDAYNKRARTKGWLGGFTCSFI